MTTCSKNIFSIENESLDQYKIHFAKPNKKNRTGGRENPLDVYVRSKED